jgi:hypothetical protein
MGFKETILALKALLESIATTNNDGGNTNMYVRMWNNQIERKKGGDGYVYPIPASFIEPQFSEGMPIGNGATSYEVVFRILVEIEHYNTEGAFDEDLTVIDTKDKVHRKLNGAKLPNCTPLFQSNTILDYNHDNVYLFVLEYSTHFVDLTGSSIDTLTGLYITDTLNDPELIINSLLDVTYLANNLLSEYGQPLLSENGELLILENNTNI